MEDRADRLNRRRQDSAAEKSASQQAARSEESQTDTEPEPQSESESTQQPEPAGSIKDQYEGIYMFLPDDLLQEFNIVANEVDSARRRQSGKPVEKIRHFEPVVVALGLEAMGDLDDDELHARFAEFDS